MSFSRSIEAHFTFSLNPAPPSRLGRLTAWQDRQEDIDPEFARAAGYEKPFMHGLCTYGFVGRAILHTLCDSKPERFKGMTGRFADRVEFKDEIVIKIWDESDGKAIVQAEDQEGRVVLSQAAAEYQAN